MQYHSGLFCQKYCVILVLKINLRQGIYINKRVQLWKLHNDLITMKSLLFSVDSPPGHRFIIESSHFAYFYANGVNSYIKYLVNMTYIF